jgi:hypothetical protein
MLGEPRGRIQIRLEAAMKAIRIAINSLSDVITARQQGRALAARNGCNGTNLTLISTVISEVARKVAQQPLPGEILMSIAQEDQTITLTLIVRVHHADRTTGVEFTPEWGPLDGFEVISRPDETILTLVQDLAMTPDSSPALDSA